jgi:hypothetical protein
MRATDRRNELLGVAAFVWVSVGCMLGLLGFSALLAARLPWPSALVLVFGWLAAGLLFIVAGLARGGLIGRICAGIALGLWVFAVWLTLLQPVFSKPHGRADGGANQANWGRRIRI